MTILCDYSLFHQFIQTYLPIGYQGISRDDQLLLNLEEETRSRRQFFYIGDLLKLKIIFASRGTIDIFGIEPEQLDPAVFYTSTHKDDLLRHNLARTKLFKMGQDLYIHKTGMAYISIQFNMKNRSGEYRPLIVQCYMFYTKVPYETVFLFQATTDISHLKLPRHGYHFYVGTDLSYFRYPDNELLKIGHVFSDREFEILTCIGNGLDSAQVADKLFLSVHTVNKHRQNILNKTGKSSTHELVLELKERGVI